MEPSADKYKTSWLPIHRRFQKDKLKYIRRPRRHTQIVLHRIHFVHSYTYCSLLRNPYIWIRSTNFKPIGYHCWVNKSWRTLERNRNIGTLSKHWNVINTLERYRHIGTLLIHWNTIETLERYQNIGTLLIHQYTIDTQTTIGISKLRYGYP